MVLFSGYGNATTQVALEALKSLLVGPGTHTLPCGVSRLMTALIQRTYCSQKEKFVDMLKRRFPPISIDRLYTLSIRICRHHQHLFENIFRNAVYLLWFVDHIKSILIPVKSYDGSRISDKDCSLLTFYFCVHLRNSFVKRTNSIGDFLAVHDLQVLRRIPRK